MYFVFEKMSIERFRPDKTVEGPRQQEGRGRVSET